MTLVLFATNARLILENLLKYGILTNPTRWFLFLVPDGLPPAHKLVRAWMSSTLLLA